MSFHSPAYLFQKVFSAADFFRFPNKYEGLNRFLLRRMVFEWRTQFVIVVNTVLQQDARRVGNPFVIVGAPCFHGFAQCRYAGPEHNLCCYVQQVWLGERINGFFLAWSTCLRSLKPYARETSVCTTFSRAKFYKNLGFSPCKLPDCHFQRLRRVVPNLDHLHRHPVFPGLCICSFA